MSYPCLIKKREVVYGRQFKNCESAIEFHSMFHKIDDFFEENDIPQFEYIMPYVSDYGNDFEISYYPFMDFMENYYENEKDLFTDEQNRWLELIFRDVKDNAEYYEEKGYFAIDWI